MLGKLVFIVVLAKFAAATGEPAEEQNRPNGCQNGEWMEGVRRQLARVNGEVNAWKNITTFIFKHLLEKAATLDCDKEQCAKAEDLTRLKAEIKHLTVEVRNATQSTSAVTNLQAQLQELRERVAAMEALGTRQNPADSCQQIAEQNPTSLPGNFWLQNSAGYIVSVYCSNTTQCHNTSGDEGWMRVANINMTDPNQQCPGEFRLISQSNKRVCGRNLWTGGCNSATFATHGVHYRKVCGRVIGYQYGTPTGFYTPYVSGNSIDGPYLEGVSLTYGQNPRKHIWSFANALQEADGHQNNQHICPCSSPSCTMQRYIPNFVGNDYFCDSGIRDGWRNGILYTNDPLWDGQGCELRSTCCTFNSPPWFCKTLPQPTNEDIEVRICADQDSFQDEDSPIELIELYVQ